MSYKVKANNKATMGSVTNTNHFQLTPPLNLPFNLLILCNSLISPVTMIKIRNQIDSDAEDVKFIAAVATDELRTIYRPTNPYVENENKKPIYIVAVVNENVVGIAEYIIYKYRISIRGLAVSPRHRRQGVAKAIVNHIALCAKKHIKANLTLSTIKETGNTNIFLHMGFNIVSEEISETFEGVNGEQVTIVKMAKRCHK